MTSKDFRAHYFPTILGAKVRGARPRLDVMLCCDSWRAARTADAVISRELLARTIPLRTAGWAWRHAFEGAKFGLTAAFWSANIDFHAARKMN